MLVRKVVPRHRVHGEPLTRVVVADDLHVGGENLIPEEMVVVVVGIDDVLHRLVGDRLDVLHQRPGRGRRRLGIDDDRLRVGDDDRGIRADANMVPDAVA